jgi:hypothetical protein
LIDYATARRRSYCLFPPGPEGRLGGPHRLARRGGRLVGSMVDGRVQIWLAQTDGELVATMWPDEYRARWEPLVLLDEQERLVARGGQEVHVVGGFLPSDDARASSYSRGLFAVSRTIAPPAE